MIKKYITYADHYDLTVGQRPSAKLKDLQKKDDFFEKYRFILPGYNLRSTDLNAIGIEQIKLDKFISIRRRNAEVYNKLFKNHEKFDIQIENSNSKSSWFYSF